ncbi:hypothetical protein V8G69_11165 [Gaetbulibacter sp. M235]|uniref:hypothetical protein n=1 Tax=Gaetbulibacter sp. M235 TaxID=3126510 RepID=UPI00374F4CA8
MKFQLNPLASDILISIYAVITLYFRFKLENSTEVSFLNSIVMGIAFVVIIWALIKLKILNPNWFGLFNSNKTKP